MIFKILPVFLVALIFAVGCGHTPTTVKPVSPERRLDRQAAPAEQDSRHSRELLAEARKAYANGKYGQARKSCEEAIGFDHTNWEAHYYLGLVYQQRRQYCEAVAILKAGLEHCPDDNLIRSEMHYNIGLGWEKTGRLDKAQGQYRAALDYNQEHRSARQGLNRIKVEKTLKNWGKDKD